MSKRGAPDYGVYQRPAIAYQDVWYDDFEGPVIKWGVSSDILSTDPYLTSDAFWKGVQSALLYTAAGANTFSRLRRVFPLLRKGKLGFEFFVRASTKTPGYIFLSVVVHDGTNQTSAEVRYDTEAETVIIRSPLGFHTIATNVYMQLANFYFLPIKLVIDIDTDHYVSLRVGSCLYDISQYALVFPVASTDEYIDTVLSIEGDAIGAMNARIDDFILTQNEP